LLSFGDIADFRTEVQYFHIPPLFHLEFRNDPLGTHRCLFATLNRRTMG